MNTATLRGEAIVVLLSAVLTAAVALRPELLLSGVGARRPPRWTAAPGRLSCPPAAAATGVVVGYLR